MRALLPLIVVIALTPNLQAQELSDEFEPEKLIEYRQDFMQAVKSHNNAIKAIVNATVPYNQHLDMHLGALEQLFAEIARLFPEGSYLIRVECYRANKVLHFAQHMEKIFIDR